MAFQLDTWWALAATFVAAVGLVLALRALVGGRDEALRERLAAAGDGARAGGARATSPIAHRDSRWQTVLRPIGRLALAGGDPEQASKLRTRLTWAGFRHGRALEAYLAAKLMAAIAFGVAALLLDHARAFSPERFAIAVVAATTLGFYLPSLWLAGRIRDRKRQIRCALPDALDLLTSCVEAGLSLEAAMDRVGQEVRLSAPALAAEFGQTTGEIEAGVARADCFRRLALRTGVAEVKSLAAVLVQTETFGTSIGRALRVLADSLRVQRMQRAQERAGSVGVRLTIPLVLCLLPSLILVVMGGATVRMVRTLMPHFERYQPGGG